MFTLRDVLSAVSNIKFKMVLFGGISLEATEKLDELCKAVGVAIMEEQGNNDPLIAMILPASTKLGAKATVALDALRAFGS